MTNSLYNPFSPLRHLNFWSVAAFETDGSSSSSSSSDDNQQAATPVATPTATPEFDNYYDAIDAGYGGQAVNIGGQNVIAATADGYTGSSSTPTSFADDFTAAADAGDISSFMPPSATDSDTGYQPSTGGSDDDFQQTFAVQSAAADADPYGSSTADGFITSGGLGVDVNDGVYTAYDPSGDTNVGLSVSGLTPQQVAQQTSGVSSSDFADYIDPITTGVQDDTGGFMMDDAVSQFYLENDEDYTPTSAELNAAIDAAGGVNLTDSEYAEPVDFTTTASGDDYNTVAQADTDVSGFEFVANTDPVTGVNTTDTLFTDEPLPPPPEEDTTPAPVYTDSAGVPHSTQAAADAADAQYAETARLENERIEAEAEAERIQALINQVVAQDSAQNITAVPVAEDADLGAAIAAAEAFDLDNNIIPDDAPITYDGNQELGASGKLDDSRYDFVDDLPDDRFDFVDETEALLAELGVDVDLLGDNTTTDAGINLESYDDANDFVETPVTNLDKVQDLVDSGVDRSLAQALVESGGTPGEPAGIDMYDFGNVTELAEIKGKKTAPSVLTDLALGDGTEDAGGFPLGTNVSGFDLSGNTGIDSSGNIVDLDSGKVIDTSDITSDDGLTDYEREAFGTDTASFYNNLADVSPTGFKTGDIITADQAAILGDAMPGEEMTAKDAAFFNKSNVTSTGGAQTSIPTEDEINAFRNQEESFSMSGGAGPVTATDTSGTSVSTSGTTDKTGTEAYLSAVNKISAEGYDPDESNLTNAEQYALYGARGQTPNAAESTYLNDLLSDATHKEDSTEKDVNGNPIYKAGDKVTVQSFGEKLEDGIVGFIDTFLNPLSIFGEKFTIGGANAAKVEAQLEAYKNGGTFIYNDDGAVTGVASPNFDASGDGNNDTVVLFDENGKKTVTGDGIAVTDVVTSNKNTDGEDFDIDIVSSVNTYKNPEDEDGEVVVESSVVVEDETGDDDDFIICEEGFEFDPVEGICMPIAGVGDGSGGGTGSPIFNPRPIRDPVPFTPKEQPTAGALKIRKPAQFAQGGMVTSNIDNFLGTLRG